MVLMIDVDARWLVRQGRYHSLVVVIERKQTLLGHCQGNFTENYREIQCSRSNNNSPPKLYFWTSNICSTKITTGVFSQESPSTLHVSYRTVKHWICPFNPNCIYEFLGQTLIAILVQNLQQKGLNEFCHFRQESSLSAKEEDKLAMPFKE